jgi:hypothetical protein
VIEEKGEVEGVQ